MPEKVSWIPLRDKKKTAYLGVYLALALICSYVESLIPFYFGIPDQIPEDVIKARFDRLLKEVQTISAEKAGALTGQTLPVLIEEKNEQDASLVTGRLSNNSVVHLPGTEDMIGKIVDVKLLECKGFYYMGECV